MQAFWVLEPKGTVVAAAFVQQEHSTKHLRRCSDGVPRPWRLPARRFFTLVLLLFLLHSMGLSLFRFQGSLCRNENIASTGGAFLFLVMLLLGGFLLAKNDIPDWWIWFYWMVCCPPLVLHRSLAISTSAVRPV